MPRVAPLVVFCLVAVVGLSDAAACPTNTKRSPELLERVWKNAKAGVFEATTVTSPLDLYRASCVEFGGGEKREVVSVGCTEAHHQVLVEASQYLLRDLADLAARGDDLPNDHVTDVMAKIHNVALSLDHARALEANLIIWDATGKIVAAEKEAAAKAGGDTAGFFKPDVWPNARALIKTLVQKALAHHLHFTCRSGLGDDCLENTLAFVKRVPPMLGTMKRTDELRPVSRRRAFAELRDEVVKLVGNKTPRDAAVELAKQYPNFGGSLHPADAPPIISLFSHDMGDLNDYMTDAGLAPPDLPAVPFIERFFQTVLKTQADAPLNPFNSLKNKAGKDRRSYRIPAPPFTCLDDAAFAGPITTCGRMFELYKENQQQAGEEYAVRHLATTIFHELSHCCIGTDDLTQIKQLGNVAYLTIVNLLGLEGHEQLQNANNYGLWWFYSTGDKTLKERFVELERFDKTIISLDGANAARARRDGKAHLRDAAKQQVQTLLNEHKQATQAQARAAEAREEEERQKAMDEWKKQYALDKLERDIGLAREALEDQQATEAKLINQRPAAGATERTQKAYAGRVQKAQSKVAEARNHLEQLKRQRDQLLQQ